jgi:transglutaminase-like putative cysteine protease
MNEKTHNFRRCRTIVLFIFNSSADAQGEVPNEDLFTTGYNVRYNVFPDGQTEVEQNIEITNNERDVIATNYTLTVKQMKLENVRASNQNKNLQTEVIEDKDTTTIKIVLDDPVIGIDKKTLLSVSYRTDDIASKVGEIWKINIPKVNLIGSTYEYNASLHVPQGFGPEIYISPAPKEKTEESNTTTYTFDIDSLENSGISGSFGTFQILNFRLKYQLKNDTNFTSKKEIALPPSIFGSQQVSYQSISPKPDKLKSDQDQNVIAVYKLKPKEEVEVKLIGSARIIGRQIKPEYGDILENIPQELINKYTHETQYWQVNSPKIQDIANRLFDPEKTVSENAQSVYYFAVNNLQYDFGILENPAVGRLGAELALDSGADIGCMEFTDTTIAILRAMKIPARELDGYAVAQGDDDKNPLSINLRGGDVLHSWVEFYDPKYGWVQIDPTWGNTSGMDYFTKTDTGHFVFAIKGSDPVLPLPAGAYKLDSNDKHVEVGFSEQVNEGQFIPKINLYKSLNLNPIKPIIGYKAYDMQNIGNSTVYLDSRGTEELLPSRHKVVYLKKGFQNIKVRDATGKEYEMEPKIFDEYLTSPLIKIIPLAISVLALCAIFYYLIKKREGRSRLSRLRDLLPQVRDRLSNLR